jgi:hypothetical protein
MCLPQKARMARFQTVIKSARFVYSPYSATEMQGFAQVLAGSIRARIQTGQNIYDEAAAPLKPALPGRRGYPDYKAARGLNPIRDWTWSGHTLRCLKVLTANENRAAIGFLDEPLPGRRMTASQIPPLTTGARRSGVYCRATATRLTTPVRSTVDQNRGKRRPRGGRLTWTKIQRWSSLHERRRLSDSV